MREELAEGGTHVVSDVLLLQESVVLSEFHDDVAYSTAPVAGLGLQREHALFDGLVKSLRVEDLQVVLQGGQACDDVVDLLVEVRGGDRSDGGHEAECS